MPHRVAQAAFYVGPAVQAPALAARASIINVRALMTGISRKERSIENITSGQYL